MATIPKRVDDRLAACPEPVEWAAAKKFEPVLTLAKSKDVNESDTLVILNDLVMEPFGCLMQIRALVPPSK